MKPNSRAPEQDDLLRPRLLTKTIEAGHDLGVISERSVEAVIMDSEPGKKTTWGVVFRRTVMEKAVAYPTDARLYEKTRGAARLVSQRKDCRI